jgi:hypothetical protein
MRFRSATANRTYTVLAFDNARDVYGRVINKIPGIRAEFRGREHIFDSEVAQKANGWTDEQRLAVERHLLDHKDFGRMRVFDLGGTSPETQLGNMAQPELYFAPGQTLPDEHLEFCQSLRWFQIEQEEEAARAAAAPAEEPEPEPTRPCMYRAVNDDDEVLMCEDPASPGHDYCETHLELVAASFASVSSTE